MLLISLKYASTAALRSRLYRPRTSTYAVIVHADVLAYAGNLFSPQQQLCRHSTRSPASKYDRSWAPTASATVNDSPQPPVQPDPERPA
jgi:hypothetical protein